MTKALRRRWVALCRAAGVEDGAAVDSAFADLVARHTEPQRHYHTLEHVDEVLQTVRSLGDPDDPGASFPLAGREDFVAVCFAGWYHDAVYDPTAGGGANEAASAELATTALHELGVDHAIAAATHRLVLLTAGHVVPALPDGAADDDGMLLVDADLGILAARHRRYDRYAAAIRAEYGHLDDDTYRAGRRKVLQTFLERPSIYNTGTMLLRCDEPARENLRRELASLDALG